ncbi:aldo/keto reductase [Pyxidicoccus parkwayensis]|jgi:pyridoxine 4-dehydrogenase|uniref:Aldo/keto reductase n=1 Tax=Pyxidicoccus parkwayensis TaxID=2813578 RepID=A0ABX7NM60_9BACT|nr:aldo/keto reductase [Pyxidicoccus parkwaysis]QSQ19952.1 aldo/keto reductase [Pyxidicoccus parkwaysis]
MAPTPNAAAAGTFKLGDLTVNRMGYGAMRITGEGIWGEPKNPTEAKAVLRRAVELGVQLIDTADSYGPDVSERLIGETLHPYPPGVVIATKGGLVRGGPGIWNRDCSPAHLTRALEGSLKRLRVERIDVYQLHAVDPRVPFEESVGTLARLREQGKIRHVALSNVSVEQLRAARRLVPIVSVQNRYNLTDRQSDDVLAECEREGLGFLPYFPLAANALTGDNSPLVQAAKRHGVTPGQLALAWLLHRSPVMLPIPGTSSVKHLEENVAAASVKLTADEMRALERG